MPRPPFGRELLESPAGLGEGAFQEGVIDDQVFGIVERFPVDMESVNQDQLDALSMVVALDAQPILSSSVDPRTGQHVLPAA